MINNCVCINCNTPIYKKPSIIKKSKNVFCNRKCQNQFQLNGRYVNCKFCNKECYKRQSQLNQNSDLFCSKKCSTRLSNYKDGNKSYRRLALELQGSGCSNKECPLILKGIQIPLKLLDVDHIDGNRKNNILSNLRVLCVFCHILITRKK